MTFNWHDEFEKDRDSFLSWVVPSAIENLSRAKFEALAAATKNWSEIDIELTINGHRLDGLAVLTKIWEQAAALIERRALQIVEEQARFARAQDIVEGIFRDARASIRSQFREIGLAFPEEEW